MFSATSQLESPFCSNTPAPKRQEFVNDFNRSSQAKRCEKHVFPPAYFADEGFSCFPLEFQGRWSWTQSNRSLASLSDRLRLESKVCTTIWIPLLVAYVPVVMIYSLWPGFIGERVCCEHPYSPLTLLQRRPKTACLYLSFLDSRHNRWCVPDRPC